jgi:hypothetical protein
MIPLSIYLQPERELLLGYNDFRMAAGLQLGHQTDESDWTTAQLAELDRDVQEAYRWCLRPQTIPGERVPHVWSWLEQTTTLVTVGSDYDYTLPSNFGAFVGRHFFWPAGSSYNPVYMVSDADIIFRRQSRTDTNRPECFALRWRAQVAGQDQRREVIFFPTPDAAYTLTYRFAIRTGVLSKTNPYPLGGQDMAQVMLEACKAIGENKRNGERGEQWNTFMASLQTAIMLDKADNTTPTVGIMSGMDAPYYEQLRGDAVYHYGPSASYGPTLYSTTP